MNARRNIPPAQEEVERRFRLILDHGDITDLASLLGEPYDTLVKKLDPNKPTAKSMTYQFAWFLWHVGQLPDGDKKVQGTLDLFSELILSTADAVQLASRIEGDARRLKEMLTAGARLRSYPRR